MIEQHDGMKARLRRSAVAARQSRGYLTNGETPSFMPWYSTGDISLMKTFLGITDSMHH